MADEIQHDGPKVLAQLTITLVGLPGGQSRTDVQCGGEAFHEIHARFMLDKARAFLDDHWRTMNAPKVIPAPNGVVPLANPIRKFTRFIE